MKWFRDVILMVVAIGLVIAVLLPEKFDTDDDEPGNDGGLAGPLVSPAEVDTLLAKKEPPIRPIDGVPHALFPMIEGARWVYVVSDTGNRAPAAKWQLKIVAAPTAAEPGIVEMGFGDALHQTKVWFDGDAVGISDLPFMAPLQYLNGESFGHQGKWLPAMAYIINDAVWQSSFQRHIEYRSRAKNHDIVVEDATMIQTDRAMVKQQETVVVPAGAFNAWLVSWISRMEIRAGKKGRTVLAKLTTEPFRRETAWFAPGIGMVRRRVTYTGNETHEDIIFSLVSFENPTTKH